MKAHRGWKLMAAFGRPLVTRVSLDDAVKGKHIEPRFFGRPARSLIRIPIELSGSSYAYVLYEYTIESVKIKLYRTAVVPVLYGCGPCLLSKGRTD
jgi:hypothetical protein